MGTGQEEKSARPRADEQGDVNTSTLREKYWQRNLLSARAEEVHRRDRRCFLRQNLSTPVLNVLSRAEGIYIEDIDGRKYIDMHGNGVHNAGFNNPDVIRAVKDQLDAGLSFCPRRYTNLPAVRLAETLARITPAGLEKSLFCPGGSEAIEMAIALARPEHDVCPQLSVGHYTHEKNALCAAAALAEIEFLEKHRLPQHAARLGQYALSRLEEMKMRHELLGNVTGIGLHLGLDLVKGPGTRERAAAEAEMVMYRCMEKGLAFKTMEGNRITLRPALMITKQEMDQALDILDAAIGEVENGLGYP
jgi:4-aminobutyrate aminotransferase-like enzyme